MESRKEPRRRLCIEPLEDRLAPSQVWQVVRLPQEAGQGSDTAQVAPADHHRASLAGKKL